MRPPHRHGLLLEQIGHAAGMVEMAVGEPHGLQLKLPLGCFLQHMRHIAAHIGEHGLAAFVIPKQRAVLPKRCNRHDFKL